MTLAAASRVRILRPIWPPTKEERVKGTVIASPTPELAFPDGPLTTTRRQFQ